MSYDDDYDRQQQRRDEERREQLRAEERREEQQREQRREDERQGEYAREDLEIERKKREEEDQREIKAIRDHNYPFPQSSRAEPAASSEAGGQRSVYRDPRAEAEALKQEMAGVLQGIANDRRMSDKERQSIAAMSEAAYLEKIQRCLLAQLDQITREMTEMQDLRLAYDPLGYQAQVQSQKLQEIEGRRQAVYQELQALIERCELLG